ncbi:TIR domain-containing protein [Micromonospora echinaurantiaca]|uniref:TIR domain-containing protein n=1 Tax=Micromonospora echinaurantiaca TaxID=47857 RepID=A0A1C5J0Z3_9ACTN|nr:TIR-like protein FxsC [Micromonospora echinaurantiaca]SCG64250.1 TIR domain-containing protein [Micromonospora echinaurantiaca]
MSGATGRRGPAGAEADPDIFFFLSFAESSDTDDELVAIFFKDLRNEVRAVSGTRKSDPAATGFLSIANLRLGADWSEEIRTALGTCRVFVALSSPTYFASESCGREWQAFADRLVAYRTATGRDAPSLLPVSWRATEIPEHLGTIQYADRSLSTVVFDEGLLHVMRLTRHRDAYHEFVGKLAALIVRTARSHPIPPSRPGPDFYRLPAAFPAVPPTGGGAGAVPRQRDAEVTARQHPDGRPRTPPDLGGRGELPRLHGN